MNTDPNGESVVSFLVILGINILLEAIDGGITAAMNGQEFWLGAGAGAISGAISGIVQTKIVFLSILVRGVSSFGYNLLNEVFQTGKIGTANLGLYSVDALMDMAFSGLYYEYFDNLGNKSIGTFFNAMIDGGVDIIENYLYFTPEAQKRIRTYNKDYTELYVIGEQRGVL